MALEFLEIPLLNASSNGNVFRVESLLGSGADVYQRDRRQKTALHYASCYGRTEVVKVLLAAGANVHDSDEDGWTAAHYAAINDHLECLKVLVEHKASIAVIDKDGDTPLHIACLWGHTAIVQYLLDKGADLHLKNKGDGWTAAHCSAVNDHLECLKVLVEHKAFIAVTDKDGNTPLHMACWKGHATIVQYLLDKGADLHLKNKIQKTALHWASHNGHTEIVKVLLAAGANVHDSDKDGWTAAHCAAINDHLECLKVLVEHKASIAVTDKDGNTPLHIACQRGRTATVQYLLDKGADLHLKNKKSQTPFQILEEDIGPSFYRYRRKECLKAVKDYMSTNGSDETSKNESQTSLPTSASVDPSLVNTITTTTCTVPDKSISPEDKKKPPVKPKPCRKPHVNPAQRDQCSSISEETKVVSNDDSKVTELLSQIRVLESNIKELSLKNKDLVDKYQHEEKQKKLQLTDIEEKLDTQTKLSHELELAKVKLESSLKKLSLDYEKVQEKYECEGRTATQEYQQKELQLAEIEGELKSQAKLVDDLKLDRVKLEQSLETVRDDMATLQYQWEEERKRSSQLMREKMRLEKELNTTKLSTTDLYHVVTSLADLQPQWEELAVSLGVPIEEIATHHSIVCRCLYETIRYWITRIGGSWEGLEEALNSERVQRHDTAEIIRRDYITGKKGKQSHVFIKESNMCQSIEDNQLMQVFQSVDWKVLGLLLGLTDDTLETIQSENSTIIQCQESMIKHWISTGQSYWSVLIEALRGPVLGEVELAHTISSLHLIGTRPANVTTVVEDEISVSDANIKGIQSEITHVLESAVQEFKCQAKGIVYIFGISGAAGTVVDVNNIQSTFNTEFKFATFRRENLTCSNLATHIKAAATFDYPVKCKNKAFYFAGHGGIDQNQQPYFNAVSENNEVISVQRHILTFFRNTNYKPSDSFVFFFDCCLRSGQETTQDRKPFAFEIPLRCLVAFATSPGLTSSGTSKEGGQFTKVLCENLKKSQKAQTLTSILDITHKIVVEHSEMAQPPQYSSCVGPIYLRGPPVSELQKSRKSFTQSRDELITLLSNKDFSTVLAFALNLDGIIEDRVSADIRQTKGIKGATLLVNSLEQAISKQPEVLPKILDKMDKVDSSLHDVVMKMRGVKKVNEEQDLTDLYKSLDQSVKKAKQLEIDNEKLQGKMKKLEEDKNRSEMKRDSAIKQIQAACSQLQQN